MVLYVFLLIQVIIAKIRFLTTCIPTQSRFPKTPNMSIVFNSNLTIREKITFRSALDTKTIHTNVLNCDIWTGQNNKYGYGILRIMFRGERIRVTTHRLSYFLNNNCIRLNPNTHVSHLCHNKLCLKYAHLSYEPSVVNAQRNACHRERACFGHQGYVGCILH